MADKKISQLTGYTTPVDADVAPIVDVTTNTTKKITWSNIKATLKTYFDTLYATLTGEQTFTNKTLTTPIIASFYQDAGKTKLMTTPDTASDTLAGLAATQTFINKRITKRIASTASSATPTPNADTTDIYILTALAADATFGAPTGSPTQGQPLIIRVKDNSTVRALGWNAIYRAMGTALPTTTVDDKTLYLGFIYNDTDSKWDLVASAQEA